MNIITLNNKINERNLPLGESLAVFPINKNGVSLLVLVKIHTDGHYEIIGIKKAPQTKNTNYIQAPVSEKTKPLVEKKKVAIKSPFISSDYIFIKSQQPRAPTFIS